MGPAVVLYLQMHQPHRLRRVTLFDRLGPCFDEELDARICARVVERCYRPAMATLLDQVRRHGGRFRFALSASGAVLEQLGAWAPDVIDRLAELGASGCCEILAETHEHSLASLLDRAEFLEQVERHGRAVERLLGVTPRYFRNTELLYSDRIAALVGSIEGEGGRPRYRGILAEGTGDRASAGEVHAAADGPLRVLLRDHTLSDDVAFRFSDPCWGGGPLTAERHARAVAEAGGRVRLLGMDLETFGEHHPAEGGILRFLAAWPAAVLAAGLEFRTPSEAVEGAGSCPVHHAPAVTSWADQERDASAWCGNAMQANASAALYRLGAVIRAWAGERRGGAAAGTLADWRRLTASDHVYYMATKAGPDGQVHRHFSPYPTPHAAFINFMHVLDGLRSRLPSRLREAAWTGRGAPTGGGNPLPSCPTGR